MLRIAKLVQLGRIKIGSKRPGITCNPLSFAFVRPLLRWHSNAGAQSSQCRFRNTFSSCHVLRLIVVVYEYLSDRSLPLRQRKTSCSLAGMLGELRVVITRTIDFL